MLKWEYRRLEVWRLDDSGHPLSLTTNVGKDDRGWYWETAEKWRENAPESVRSKLYAGGRTPTRLPLNPAQDWGKAVNGTPFAWNEVAGYGDLEMNVINELGKEGWEIVSVYGGYLFKRPID